jgi:phosphatidylserine decarboxylase
MPRRRHHHRSKDTSNEYKALAVRLSLWGQKHGVPGASPAVLTKLARHVATRSNPELVERFITQYGIDYKQAEKCSATNTAKTCAVKYGSLNDFFTRKIRDIKIDDSSIVSPATCKAVVFDTFDGSKIWVKGQRWSAARMLRQPDEHLSDYAVGIFRLRPADYHRFHAPVSGKIVSIDHIRGGYLSVDPVVVHHRNVFTENNRAVVGIQSPEFGLCHFVAVGAAGVGAVKIYPKVGASLKAGDMLGSFEFGGSTVVVLIPATGRAVWRKDLASKSLQGQETYVHVGEAVSSM